MATTPDGEPLYYKIDYPYFELLKEGQIVNAYMMINNMVFCFDLNGKKVVFSNINDLTKTPTTGSIGLMSQDSEQETMDGPTLCCGYYWILSQNTSNGTVKIQLPSSIVEIQESKISFWKKAMSNEYNNAFKSNEDNYVYRIITVE